LTAEDVTALASAGALLVISATAIAAFIQLRHMGTSNQLMVLNGFREAFESPTMATARNALPEVLERLSDPESRRELMVTTNPQWVRPVLPLMRLLETLGTYANRNIVSKDLVCDMWAPVVVAIWNGCAPLIAVMRRRAGPTLFENWEMLAVLSRRWLDEGREAYPKHLPRMDLCDPWAAEDGISAEADASQISHQR
jgi:hypothetical protein